VQLSRSPGLASLSPAIPSASNGLPQQVPSSSWRDSSLSVSPHVHVGKRVAEFAIAAAVVAAAGATTVLVYRGSGHDPAVLSFRAFTAVVLLWGLLSHVVDSGRHRKLPVAPGRVLAIIPAYNETTGALHATVEAVLRQTIACDIIVVDDGSVNPLDAFRNPRVRWVRQPNGGKRAAQVTALYATERGDYEFIRTVDSDSEPYPDALEQLLRAMSDPQVWAATGWVHTRNYTDNWVARARRLRLSRHRAPVPDRHSRRRRVFRGARSGLCGDLAGRRGRLSHPRGDREARAERALPTAPAPHVGRPEAPVHAGRSHGSSYSASSR